MSKLEELITELCPGGVKYISACEASNMSAGDRVTKAQMNDDMEYPVMGAGVVPTGYYNKWNKENCVTISRAGAGCGSIGWHPEKFWATDVCFLAEEKSEIAYIKYIYYAMMAQEFELKKHVYGGSMPKIDKTYLWKMTLPIPPLPIQREIIRILDNFTDLTAKLQAELELRKSQYEEVAHRLLLNNNEVERKQLKDICVLTKGKSPIQKTEPGEYPMVVTTSDRKSSSTYQFDDAAVCIPLVSSRGHGVASLNHVYYQEGKFALGNILCAVTSKDENYVSMKYLYYYFECTKDYTLVPLMKGGANVSMHIPDIEKVKVPIPSIEKQKEIISMLEKLEKYCYEVLPAEIEARQKQYEYYRDKILTFKEAV